MITQIIAKKILPDVVPVFGKMTDMELLSIVSWAQRWDAEQVYDTAFDQVFPGRQIEDAKPKFDSWVTAENPRLPVIVREELITAFRIHMTTGRMDVLRLGAMAATYSKRIMWVCLAVSVLFLVL
jgi:hypothetical protein